MNSEHKKQLQLAADSFRVAALLALVGGFLDAYTYLCRGKVFANAQTGNLVLLALAAAKTDWHAALRYSIPILFFAVGVFVVQCIKAFDAKGKAVHWRQVSLALEMIAITATAFLSTEANAVANSVVSLVCSIQVQSFRTVKGNAFASTMCTGNLRSGTEQLHVFLCTKNRAALRSFVLYFGVIACFIAGAILGSFCTARFSLKAVLSCNVPLGAVFVLLLHE